MAFVLMGQQLGLALRGDLDAVQVLLTIRSGEPAHDMLAVGRPGGPPSEPSSLMLAALGFAGMAAWRWRRRKR